MKPHEVLERAADLLTETGLAQGSLAYDRDGNERDPLDEGACSFCAEGAMRRVARVSGPMADHPDAGPAWLALHSHVRAIMAASSPTPAWWGVSNWNDIEGRAAEDVARELRAVAAKLRQEQGA